MKHLAKLSVMAVCLALLFFAAIPLLDVGLEIINQIDHGRAVALAMGTRGFQSFCERAEANDCRLFMRVLLVCNQEEIEESLAEAGLCFVWESGSLPGYLSEVDVLKGPTWEVAVYAIATASQEMKGYAVLITQKGGHIVFEGETN